MTAVVIGLAVAGGILLVSAAVIGAATALSRARLRLATLRAERERDAIDANQDWIYGLSGRDRPDAPAAAPADDARTAEQRASDMLAAALVAKAELEQRLEREQRALQESHRKLAELLSGALDDLSRVGATANGDHPAGDAEGEPLERVQSLP